MGLKTAAFACLVAPVNPSKAAPPASASAFVESLYSIPTRKQSIKRNKKCQLCGSTKHTTPRHHLGTVTY